jgi:SOS-response transcriptional repressor LexA
LTSDLFWSTINPRAFGIYEAIGEYQDKNGYPPTLQEIADAVGFLTKTAVLHHMGILTAVKLVVRRGTLRTPRCYYRPDRKMVL